MKKRTALSTISILFVIPILLLLIFGMSFTIKTMFIFAVYASIYILVRYKGYGMLLKIMNYVFILFIISFIVIMFQVLGELNSNDEHVKDIDFVVILGAGLDGTQLSKTLKQRLDQSIEYLNHNHEVRVILSGGQGPGEAISEAEAMGEYLISNGIEEERLIYENKSTTTKENIQNSKDIIEKLGVSKPKVMIITSDYHMYRAKMIAEKISMNAYGISSKTPIFIRINYLIREYFAVIKTLLG